MPDFDEKNIHALHTEYKALFDKIITVKLRENFGEEVINHFFRSFFTMLTVYRQADNETSQAITEMLDANAFLMAMRLRKQVYVSELDKKNLSSNHLTANMNNTEEFFWKLHNSDPESWKKQANVNNEEM